MSLCTVEALGLDSKTVSYVVLKAGKIKNGGFWPANRDFRNTTNESPFSEPTWVEE